MIHVQVDLADGQTRVETTGHADPATCAVVSALLHTAVLGLAEIARQRPDRLNVTITES